MQEPGVVRRVRRSPDRHEGDFEDNEEERDRNFFGDEDYGTLKNDFMSMTMQQRDA